jgi:CDP-diacylglycerol--serine O-phosphatidyltransferase
MHGMKEDLKMTEFQSAAPTPPTLRRRSAYLLPNLFTTIALFAGFYAIVQAMTGRFDHSALAIFVAMIFDGLDGRIARLTRTQSAFGAEYDSLSDMVSFGAAPALLAFEWAMKDMGKWGWVAAFIYCAGAALRLARFNANINVVDKRYFQGLPSPAAAALVAGLVWIAHDLALPGAELRWYAFALTIFAGLSMVTSVPYWSGKALNLRRSLPFMMIILAAFIYALIYSYPPGVVLVLFFIYSLSGYFMAGWRYLKQKTARIPCL